MKFTVSSTLLSNALQTASKVITGRCALPILDNFLLTLKSDHLIITSSDSETTMKLKIEVNEVIEEGAIAVDTTLYEVIKDFPEQPVEIQSNSDRKRKEAIIKSRTSYFITRFPLNYIPKLHMDKRQWHEFVQKTSWFAFTPSVTWNVPAHSHFYCNYFY